MDEDSDHLDQLFKDAAQNAAGLAEMLDANKAIERGTRRRTFARRRKTALSGTVVLVAVVDKLVAARACLAAPCPALRAIAE